MYISELADSAGKAEVSDRDGTLSGRLLSESLTANKRAADGAGRPTQCGRRAKAERIVGRDLGSSRRPDSWVLAATVVCQAEAAERKKLGSHCLALTSCLEEGLVRPC